MRRALTLLVLSVGLLALAIGPVGAHTKRATSKVIITRAAGGLYKGNVFSRVGACEDDRIVRVFHNSMPRYRIGTTRTRPDGSWSLRGAQPPRGDDVYAVVQREVDRRNARHLHVCRPDASPLYEYPYTGPPVVG